MSDEAPFPVEPKPLMSARRARDLSRNYKAWAEYLVDQGLSDEAVRAERSARWWMQYSLALAAEGPLGIID